MRWGNAAAAGPAPAVAAAFRAWQGAALLPFLPPDVGTIHALQLDQATCCALYFVCFASKLLTTLHLAWELKVEWYSSDGVAPAPHTARKVEGNKWRGGGVVP